MSASLDFKRTFQYSQALYSVVRFSLKLFYYDIDDLLRYVNLFDDISGNLICNCLLSFGNRIFFGDFCRNTDNSLGLAVDLNRNLDLIILHKLLIVSRPLCMENGILMTKLLPNLLCNMRNKR